MDDETLLVEMYKTALESEGYTVLTAASGEQGLSMIQGLKPDLVLLDIMMPELTGLDILDKMREDPELAKIPVIMLTNLTWIPDPTVALKKGALDVWVKAKTKPKQVVAKVNKFWEGRK